ncbi:MAG TPA: hypothetical protein ENI23_06975 [bacterium]|nr:hypothetical protein [bacterium]
MVWKRWNATNASIKLVNDVVKNVNIQKDNLIYENIMSVPTLLLSDLRHNVKKLIGYCFHCRKFRGKNVDPEANWGPITCEVCGTNSVMGLRRASRDGMFKVLKDVK